MNGLENQLIIEVEKLNKLIDKAIKKDMNLGKDKKVVEQSRIVDEIINKIHARYH